MASPSVRRDLKALRNLINQADLSLALVPEHPSIASARESLNAALALSRDLVKRLGDPLKTGAAALGAKGGSKTAERGPDYYAQIAAMRKNRRGGRPRKRKEN
jgi:uncharacterized protein involved in exopolysaccharide biosynthesis